MNIAIASGKGGTGKTTVATNLAVRLAEEQKILLADLDVEEPNTGIFIRGVIKDEIIQYAMIPQWQEDNCSLCGKCRDMCNFNAILDLGKEILIFPNLCHSCYACSELCPESALPMTGQRIGITKLYDSAGLIHIESLLDVGQERAVPLIQNTKKLIGEMFPDTGTIIYDAPPGTSCPVIESVKDADFIVLVTEPTPFGLHDLEAAVTTFVPLDIPMGVVINRSDSGNGAVTDYCTQNGLPVLARIPDQRKIAELYSRGSLIYTELDEFRHQMEEISERISEITG